MLGHWVLGFMRSYFAAFAVIIVGATSAEASSFVVIDAPTPASTPSVIVADASSVMPASGLVVADATPVKPAARNNKAADMGLAPLDPLGTMVSANDDKPRLQPVTASIVAIVEPHFVSDEMVAAISAKPGHSPGGSILVMRGGIAGDAFPVAQDVAELSDTVKRMTPAQWAAPNWLLPKKVVTQPAAGQPGQGDPQQPGATPPLTKKQEQADKDAVRTQLR